MQEPKAWGRGEVIDVFDNENLSLGDLHEIISLIQERKVSSFVFGKLVDKRDYSSHTVLRRYFPE